MSKEVGNNHVTHGGKIICRLLLCRPNRLKGITTDVNNSSVCCWWARQGRQTLNIKGAFWAKPFPYDFCKNNTVK